MLGYNLNFYARLLKISEEELKKLVEEKKKQLYNLIDDETALLLVLKDFGIKIKPYGVWKVKDLFSGVKVSQISLIIGKKLKENVYEAWDETGRLKLKVKENIELKEGQVIRVKNAFVARNKTLILIVKSCSQIEEEKDERIIENLTKIPKPPYISEFFGIVLNKENQFVTVLTEKFKVLKLISNQDLEIGRTYHIKTLGKEIIYSEAI